MITRRSFTAAAIGLNFSNLLPARAQVSGARKPAGVSATPGDTGDFFAALEKEHGGRLGVVAMDSGSKHVSFRADERFAMCSTHKFLSAAAILNMVDRGNLSLEKLIPYGPPDLLEYAPITRKNVGTGAMSVGALCAATLQWGDNTAGNLLLRLIDGPGGWTRYARSIGDDISRLDRNEPTLNTAIAGDPRDTTTPAAMVRNLNQVLLGKVLSASSRKQLLDWMIGSEVTANLLHAGLPEGWRIADKSGAGDNNTRNDIGIILRPSGEPILVAVYYTQSPEPLSSREKVIAEIGRFVSQAFSA